MSKQEIKLTVICMLLVVAFATNSWHKISAGWLLTIAVFIMFLPGISLAQAEDFKQAKFPFLLFVVSCFSIGAVANYLNVGTVIAEVVYPLIQGSPIKTLTGVYAFGYAINYALTPLAAYSAFTAPVVEIANAAGLNPIPVIYTFINSLNQVGLPYEFTPTLVIFGYGMMSMKSFAKYCSVKAVIGLVCVLVIFVPYWMLIGLM